MLSIFKVSQDFSDPSGKRENSVPSDMERIQGKIFLSVLDVLRENVFYREFIRKDMGTEVQGVAPLPKRVSLLILLLE